jgi:hypothetical protein
MVAEDIRVLVITAGVELRMQLVQRKVLIYGSRYLSLFRTLLHAPWERVDCTLRVSPHPHCVRPLLHTDVRMARAQVLHRKV